MRQPPDPPTVPSHRRRPPAMPSAPACKAVARMRRALIRNRGGDGGDRPDYLAYLAARGLWIDEVDWTKATDAEVIARTQAGEPPEPPRDDEEGRRLTETILRGLGRLRARGATGGADAAPPSGAGSQPTLPGA